MSNAAKSAYLTPDAYDRLKVELETLSTEGRAELSKRIEAARLEGDLKENGGYHAAKEEQGKMEARIRQLTQLLESAVVGDTPPPDDGVVEPGMVVTVELFGEEETFLLGHREIQDHTDVQVFSEASPLGQAVNGKVVGDTVSYHAPSGKTIEAKILAARPYAS
ncbi:MAG: transcription elongation factor GreA [Dermatophilaceae bacterium]|jgi:transcription elongation factor GreA|nr:transcription elongation factor GreA [Actinomycetales bacterium]MBP8879797.1 transcription elongation factor GreA [Dermatophilaceae bacterium]MBP9917579.1 transcription elongation factor GreA [Dermatophilaceae bacterium]